MVHHNETRHALSPPRCGSFAAAWEPASTKGGIELFPDPRSALMSLGCVVCCSRVVVNCQVRLLFVTMTHFLRNYASKSMCWLCDGFWGEQKVICVAGLLSQLLLVVLSCHAFHTHALTDGLSQPGTGMRTMPGWVQKTQSLPRMHKRSNLYLDAAPLLCRNWVGLWSPEHFSLHSENTAQPLSTPNSLHCRIFLVCSPESFFTVRWCFSGLPSFQCTRPVLIDQ